MAVIEPLEHLNDAGRAGILFVLPWLRKETDVDIDGNTSSETFFRAVQKAKLHFAAITLKSTPGIWSEGEIDKQLLKNRTRIDACVEKYRPSVVVFMGVNFAKRMVPAYKQSSSNIQGTFSKFKLQSGKSIPCMVWSAPDAIIDDPFEHVRIPETLAKLWSYSSRRYYDRKPDITNLNTYKSAAEYIDFLANEHTGMIGFDTEAYSLNRVHHQRLGSMQFCADANDSKVLLWDSKHQELTKREMEKLTPKLVHLFGSPKTSFDSWIMHNGQFDVMQIRGAFNTRMPKPVFDTMLFAHLMDENRKETARVQSHTPFALKILVQEFLGFFHYNAEAMKARSDGTLMALPLPDFLDYSGYDPIVTYRMFEVLKQWAKYEKYDESVLNILRHLHSRALKMYADMSKNGFAIDDVKLKQLLAKNSVINARLTEIKEEYKHIPEIQKVNKELAESEAESNMFLRIPWIFNMDKAKHRHALFFHSKHGYKYPANEEGKYSTGKKFQKDNSSNKVVAMYADASGLVKLRNAYIKPIFETMFANPDPNADTCDGRAHPEFQLHRTVTGRVACIAKGTKIEVARGFKDQPHSIYVENIVPGDRVYCYTKTGKLAVREVTESGCTGIRSIIRIHWSHSVSSRSGYLDLTHDHRVRMTDGSYLRADALTSGSSVSALYLQKLNDLDSTLSFEPQSADYLVTHTEKLSGKVDVYDITVKGCHNFIANEICVHNCRLPNTQQVPRSDSPVKKEIKALFIPGPGKILIQADLSSAEVRVWGALSGDEQICRLSQEAFVLLERARANPDDKKLKKEADLMANFHKQTYGLCYHIDPASVTPPQRQIAKKLTFGICYGMSSTGLARELGVTVEEAEAIKKIYFGVYKGGEKWLMAMQTAALTDGYVETPLGRRRRMPQVFTGDRRYTSEAKRFAVNAPIQATASDYAMLSTCILNDAIIEADIEDDVKLVNAVHDSVVLEVTATADWIQYVTKLVRRVFTKDVVKVLKRDFNFELKAPIDIDIEVSQHIMHKCKKCGHKYYPGEGNVCPNEIKTGNKKEDGSDEKVPCGHDKYEEFKVGGWGYLMAMEENAQGIAKAMKGIIKTEKSAKVGHANSKRHDVSLPNKQHIKKKQKAYA